MRYSALTFFTITLPSKRRVVRAKRIDVKARRIGLNRFGVVRTLGRRPLRAVTKIVEPYTVRWCGGLFVTSIVLR